MTKKTLSWHKLLTNVWLCASVESLGKGGTGSDCDCQALCERDEYNIMTSYAPLSMAMNRRLTLSTTLPENYLTILRLQVNLLFRPCLHVTFLAGVRYSVRYCLVLAKNNKLNNGLKTNL